MKTYKELLEEPETYVVTYKRKNGETIIKSFPSEQMASDWNNGTGKQFSPAKPKTMSKKDLAKFRKETNKNNGFY